MKKKFVFLLISLISVFGVSWEVYGIGSNGSSAGGSSPSSSGGYYTLVTFNNNYSGGIQGFRLSAYKIEKSGSSYKTTKLGHSIDVIKTSGAYSTLMASANKNRLRRSSGIYSKIDYLMNDYYLQESLFSKTGNTYIYDLNSQSQLSGIKSALSGTNIFGSGVDSKNPFRARLDKYFKNGDNFENLIKFMNNNNSSFTFNCSDNIYLFAEPLTVVGVGCSGGSNCKKLVMGTMYELTIFAYNDTLSAVVRKNMANGLYISSGNDNLGYVGEKAFISNVKSFTGFKDGGNKNFFYLKENFGYGLNAFWTYGNDYCDIPFIPTDPTNPIEPDDPTELEPVCDFNNNNDFPYSSKDSTVNCCDYFSDRADLYTAHPECAPVCIYDREEDFPESSVDSTVNCCEYFSDPSRRDQYPNLVEDYPVCGDCSDVGATGTTSGSCTSNVSSGSIVNDILSGIGNFLSNWLNSSSSTSSSANVSGSTVVIKDNRTITDNTCLPITETIDGDNASNFTEFKINDYCSIKCVEEDTIKIPKSPSNITINVSHFVWPSSPSTANQFGNDYVMSGTGKLTCRIVVRSVALSNLTDASLKSETLNQCALIRPSANIPNDLSELYNYNPTIKLTYTPYGKTTATTTTTLETYDESVMCEGGSDGSSCERSKFSTDANIASIRNLRFTITKEMKYKLPATLNTYVLKTDTTRIDTSSDVKNYTIVGYGNIPVRILSNNQSLAINYYVKGTLKVYVSNLGHVNQSGVAHFGSTNTFTCDADFEALYDDSGNNNSTKYYCRVGTDKTGMDVSSCIDSNGILDEDCVAEKCVSETPEYYCSSSSPSPSKPIDSNLFETKVDEFRNNAPTNSYETEDYVLMAQNYFDSSDECSIACDPTTDPDCCDDSTTCVSKCDPSDPSCNTKYICPIDPTSKYSGMDITSCVASLSFNSIDERIEACRTKCDDNNKYTCPNNTDYAGWDITICILNSKANNLADAQTLCQNAICNTGNSGQVVIYRPIDLDNPFPSITGVTDSSTKLGRLPGANWRYSTSLSKDEQVIVEEYITKNRNETTEDVYSKTPLYTFELKTSTIKAIREYNKDKEFDDFDLECNAGRECISNFVHDATHGFNSSNSTCVSTGHDQFYKCLQ